ncbi:tetratricopeptide repeat protein [Methylocaldum sp.]|uniref:tetratricopeptide repeat protein n=1 Tax=Methylocaldum sp. TaxID=1969727 RepID=UPI002D4BEA60|nr:tetratricopeptide repeat protein [Methylocaldum sp.]HYE34744.1 tetratricopeptide repeat protein [Methylocaldum sp.]
MSFTRFSYRASVLAITFVTAMLAAATSAQEFRLGTVNFPTSAESEKARVHFLRGVTALHSFSYDLALDEFRKSVETEPDFMMGYWGEAMTYNHPLWGQQDTEAARKVLARIKDTPKPTPRERAYLHAVKILYGEGDKVARDQAYAAAMEEVYRDYPDDLEGAAFYALALLGSVRSDDPAGLRIRMRAGAITLEIARKEPNHPGATHYILHAFDDPDHAVLALPAARRYAEIAPEAPHALHMPSHIFLQLGMWPEAASTQEKQWVQQKNVPIGKRDYHSLYWLLYVYLQQGRYSEAEALLTEMQKSLAEGPKDDRNFQGYGTFIYSGMVAAFVVETTRWDLATKLIDPLQKDAAPFIDSVEGSPGPYQAPAQYVQALWIFTRGMAAAQKNSPDAQKSIDALQALEQRAGTGELPGVDFPLSKILEIQRLEIAAVTSASKGNLDEAIKSMKQASALEDSVPPLPGPAPQIKPSHELFGEILLQADRPAEAEKQFGTALLRQPDRARLLLGAARAAARQGDRENAMSTYSKVLRQWQQSDRGLPELQEAQNYLKQASPH